MDFAGRLRDRLAARFGEERIFLDITNIPLSFNFVDVLTTVLAGSKAMFAIIGKSWLGSQDDAGHRRLEDPEDFVRMEIRTALDRRIPIVPVLVDGAKMPGAGELPADIAALARRQGHAVSNANFETDLLRLMSFAEDVLDIPVVQAPPPIVPRRPPTHTLVYIRDVLNRVQQLAQAALGDELERVRTEDNLGPDDFYSVMARTQKLNAEFAVRVAWSYEDDELYVQVDQAKSWMRNHGLPGIIAVRRYPTQQIISELNFDGNETHIQLLVWRNKEDNAAMKLSLQRVAR